MVARRWALRDERAVCRMWHGGRPLEFAMQAVGRGVPCAGGGTGAGFRGAADIVRGGCDRAAVAAGWGDGGKPRRNRRGCRQRVEEAGWPGPEGEGGCSTKDVVVRDEGGEQRQGNALAGSLLGGS